eukprot:TRINITY_DN171_c0_g1_i5.p1 TRINITY_DN171_c0_g1~~TRINITY_DN171_c0_g1_i5.p1  ORF type:complete len:262 (+),score=119.60 TRINITY_DN171_c0_g1_i5:117-902(+)
MSEEDRLLKSMNKKADEAFEKKRREALEKYAQKTGNTDFQLAEKPEQKKVVAGHKEFVPKTTAEPQASTSSAGHEQQSVVSAPADHQPGEHGDELKKWKEEQDKKEEEFKQRLSEEQRKKAELLKRREEEEYEEKRKQAAAHEAEQRAKKTSPEPVVPEIPANCCVGCRREFQGILDIFIVKEKKYCKECSIKALTDKPGAPKCGHCSLPLSASIVKAAGKKFHPECFVCCKCGQPIRGGFRAESKTTFVCVSCTSSPFGK